MLSVNIATHSAFDAWLPQADRGWALNLARGQASCYPVFTLGLNLNRFSTNSQQRQKNLNSTSSFYPIRICSIFVHISH